ncbi:MAG: MgtC/SapB family protein [Candidatus Pacebacteria bacterium]|nr:MgtC/SapB family protein [Candidatus Paceibacterota bacterium]
MEPFIITNSDIIIRLVLAMLLGCLVGSERLFAGKTAGMRTYALVSLGATVYVVVSLLVTNKYMYVTDFDPLRMASQIIVGVGFLGAGLIVFKDSKLNGLTTAAGLWLSAAVGVAVGYGLFELAILASFLTLFIFVVLGFLKKKLQKMPSLHFPDEHRTTDEDEEV